MLYFTHHLSFMYEQIEKLSRWRSLGSLAI